jgi:uncharacterized protein YjbI with pentapeptide repeats
MANEEHLAILKKGVAIWNEWREASEGVTPDLYGADLRGVKLIGANLNRVNFSRANLANANFANAHLIEANLAWAKLSDANFTEAVLVRAFLNDAWLINANFTNAFLNWANLAGANLTGANLTGTYLGRTTLAQAHLADVKGLEACNHRGPSDLGVHTLMSSRHVPLVFLRGCDLPDSLIEYLPSLRDQAIEFYSCFISYSTKDQEFADRLHADLQNKGVRCWFAPHDLPWGAKTWDTIDEAIRIRDKVLLLLSENSIASDWVEDEVSKAFAEERGRKGLVLFPVRLDDAVMETAEPWAVKLRDQRNIGDFRGWKDHDAYQRSLEKLLRWLKVEKGAGEGSPAAPGR